VAVANPLPVEATMANAGARRCRLRAPVHVSALRRLKTRLGRPAHHDLQYAFGFGERGGLVVWRSQDAVRGAFVDARGEVTRELGELALHREAVLDRVVPVRGGFVVLATRNLFRQGQCPGRCSDPTCASWTGPNVPHVCQRPCLRACDVLEDVHALVVFVPLGDADQRVAARSIGVHRIIAATPAHAGEFAFLTDGDEVVTVRLTREGFSLATRGIEPLPVLLPVRGEGPPSMLQLDQREHVDLLDATGQHRIAIDERVTDLFDVAHARVQARRGPDGLIHLAWASGYYDMTGSFRYGAIDGSHTLRPAAPSSGSVTKARGLEVKIQPPFDDYVVAALIGNGAQRRSWVHASVGEPVRLRERDPDYAVRHARVVWSGSRFIFAYVVEGAAGPQLRLMSADCR
jgi:hypothetical protein